jgi:EAL domain-containing protein (putative c-di-GMP-specific phosphodiesterase class I)
VGNKTVFVTASIGIAISGRGPDASAERLLRNADIALHQAKKEGRAAYRFFEEAMNVRFQARKNLEQDLRQAMSQGQFVLHYQPQIDLATGWAIGAEALIRWQHPHRGLISPAEFIPLAEDTGLIVPLGEWVLQAACAEAAAWRHLSLAVNLSPAQFRQPQLSEMVARVVTETTIEPHRLELEITENLLLHDTKATLATLRLLKEIGVRIAMDDFGTGYSSLGYLHRFPFDKIKIDRTFIRDLGHSAEATAIVRAIIGLGHSLGMRAVAEGVETKEQVVLLKKEGCHEVQGYYFARPMPAAELSRFLDRQAARAEKPVASQHGGGVPARTPKISLAAAAARISPRKPS